MADAKSVDGHVDPAFEPVARAFRAHFEQGSEVGAGVCIYAQGRCVVDLWGGWADVATRTPWQRDTRAVLFSVTKAMTAIAFHLLADRGLLRWDDRVATHWPGFGRAGKERITIEVLLGHTAGLAALDTQLRLEDCLTSPLSAAVVEAMETQRPRWEPGTDQGYHAATYGMYAAELFRRIAGQSIGSFLQREYFEPLDSDVRLGTDEALQRQCATLYPPTNAARLANMAKAGLFDPMSAEGGIARDILRRDSLSRAAFGNPAPGRAGVSAYNTPAVRGAELAWASATGTARGVAKAMAPLSLGGEVDGRRCFAAETLAPLWARAGWSERDRVLHRPMGWNRGFLKEAVGVFGPDPACFGHSGIGGALAWCDPERGLAFGYVPTALDWRVRSPRTKALVAAMYEAVGA